MSATLLLSLAALTLAAPPPPPPPGPGPGPAALALVVASNRGARPGRAPLQYADDDGAKYHRVLSAIAGEERTLLLTDLDRDTARLFPALLDQVRSPTRPQLDLAVARLARQVAELRRAGQATRFYFVFAGHGDVDGGRGFLELADGPLTADDLQQLLRAVGATESHVILDSCNSFFVVNPRKPGGARFPTPRDAAEVLARRLPDVGVFLSTSAQAEVYEWSELQSGVFSHAVRSGLLGAADADLDGQVGYDELAAFVDTAVSAIRNPAYRPHVFARAPNGEAGRAILSLPPAHAALLVDEPEAVRLAVRDPDGLRWLDLHAEGGRPVRLWLPPGLRGGAEVDRLSMRPVGVRLDAALALAPVDEGPARLADLRAAPTTVAMRGAGDIFQALFARPFGPAAVEGWRSAELGRSEALLALEPVAAPPRLGPEACEAGAPATPWSWSGAAPYAVLRGGATWPRLSASGRLSLAGESVLAAGASAAAGLELNPWAAVELEAGLHRLSATSVFFAYPSASSPYTPVVGTRVGLLAAPLTAGVRLRLPALRPSPYLLAAGGLARVQATFDPPDFNATLRASRWVPVLQLGAGALVDLGERGFIGVEARWLHLSDFRAVDSSLRVGGLSLAATVGVRR